MNNFEKWRQSLTVESYVSIVLDNCDKMCFICPVGDFKKEKMYCKYCNEDIVREFAEQYYDS